MKNKKKIEAFKLNGKIDLLSTDDEKVMGLIYDIKEGKIYVSISADSEDFKLLKIGETVKGLVPCRDEMVVFDASVTDKIFENTSIYELSEMRNFKRIQRRENIRVRFTKELYYIENEEILEIDSNHMSKDDLFEKLEKHLREGIMLDLSAGGLKLSTKIDMNIGRKLMFVLDFIDDKLLVKGKIVHKELNLVSNKTIYIYGIKFLDIKEGDKEKIIKYLFVIMRKNRIR